MKVIKIIIAMMMLLLVPAQFTAVHAESSNGEDTELIEPLWNGTEYKNYEKTITLSGETVNTTLTMRLVHEDSPYGYEQIDMYYYSFSVNPSVSYRSTVLSYDVFGDPQYTSNTFTNTITVVIKYLVEFSTTKYTVTQTYKFTSNQFVGYNQSYEVGG